MKNAHAIVAPDVWVRRVGVVTLLALAACLISVGIILYV